MSRRSRLTYNEVGVKENKSQELFHGADHAGLKPCLVDRGSRTFELVLRNQKQEIDWINYTVKRVGSSHLKIILRPCRPTDRGMTNSAAQIRHSTEDPQVRFKDVPQDAEEVVYLVENMCAGEFHDLALSTALGCLTV